jgi:hypothetical protein
LTEGSIRRRSPLASKENKSKYVDEKEKEVAEESMVTSKKRWVSYNDNDDDDSASSTDDVSSKEVSFEEEHAR